MSLNKSAEDYLEAMLMLKEEMVVSMPLTLLRAHFTILCDTVPVNRLIRSGVPICLCIAWLYFRNTFGLK
ncbi:MAG: hypothetical protein VZQ84_01975 [Anaerovoracaceae bacterium]|nr:hypothetical protein [Anaerovoracaceae bacterium]